jgi:glycerol-3-phosphate acyltransferase PlsX
VPPSHEDAREPLQLPLGNSGREPVIAVDAMGGDYAPDEIVAGALAAQREHRLTTLLTGPPARLRPVIARLGGGSELRVVPAEDVVGMGEGALAGFRRPRSSIAVACQLVRRGQASAVVSAGSTGAIVASARHRLLPLPNVPRPGLAVLLPTYPKPTVLIDAGATADPKPEMLVQFGHLGVAYAQIALGTQAPKVGLLTIGAEPGKGNALTRRAHELLAAEPQGGGLPLYFAGNIEGGDLTSTRAARLGAALQRRGLRELSHRLEPETYGGAALLGLGGTVVIAHGASTARAVTAACELAANLTRGDITERVKERIGVTEPRRPTHFLRRDRER